ncbi:MAG: hypothetical protein K6B69_09680 [Lachnospiraceae bacterium]|nr:hypothetical protein [Lachnospiraceae bacterium]
MAAKSANLYAWIEPGVKVPAIAAAHISNMSAVALNDELENGYADIKAGRTRSPSEVFADIRKDYNV